METGGTYETLAIIYQTTRSHIPYVNTSRSHHCESF